MTTVTAAAFMATAPPPPGGSSAWASRYAAELRRIMLGHAARAPRTLQEHLGPSELGVSCDRQVAGKFAALPSTNHVSDPWPSIVGTACHAWAADAFTAENTRTGELRFVAEQRVTPHPDHPGTADLYDAREQCIVDHKFLGESSMAKVRKSPPRRYVVQLLLYGRGYRNLGLPVRRVVLAAYPRTAPSLDGLYVWSREYTPADDELLAEVFAQTAVRREWGQAIAAGTATLTDVPHNPSADECFFCPFYRPQAAHDSQTGCPGHVRIPTN